MHGASVLLLPLFIGCGTTSTLFIGCGTTSTPHSDTAVEALEEPAPPAEPSPWEYDGSAPPPIYDQDALEDTINTALRDVMTISGAPAVLGYVTMMAEADESCPTWYSYEGSSYWAGGCTTAGGASFDGYIFAETYEDAALMGDGSSMNGMFINGQAILTSATGTRLDLSGYAVDSQGTINDGATLAWTTAVVGAFGWDDDIVADTWLGGPLQPTLDAQALQFDFGGGYTAQFVQFTGGLSGLDSQWQTAYFDHLRMVDEVTGFWDCGIEPAGVINVRSADGYWYQVTFDVEELEDGTFAAPTGQCDGCGTVNRNGEEVGEACVDVSPLIDWEDQPW